MNETTASSRRDFLKASTAAALSSLAIPAQAYVSGGDLLRVGLVGCGGRGTGAAAQALEADKNVRLVAMGDVFADRLQKSLQTLKGEKGLEQKIDVKPEHQYVGFDAYKGVIEQSDVVLLCTPPGFRPLHLKAAVEAGKHIFAEKPIAVDAPGVRSVLATCEEAKKKNLSIVSGLCLRYGEGFRKTVERIHDGGVGEIVALQANDYRGDIWVRARQPGWNDMEWQMRNWYYFTWLSGDFNVEQHVHYLDVCAWLMKDRYPVRAVGMGGRQVRTGPEHGNIYDHFSVVYEYDNGVRLYSNCRQQGRCKHDISATVLGSRGKAILSDGGREDVLTISGATPWNYEGNPKNMYQVEHDELFASIRGGKPINNGEYMAKSTLLAIMGRMSAYTGQAITWEQAMNSQEDLSPPKHEWGENLVPPVAIPGRTKFI